MIYFDMIYLNALLRPDWGLVFWTTLIFLLLWTLLGKYAWKPISNALSAREEKISSSLHEADKAREEMASLKADHQKLINEAKEERARIIKEAKEIKEDIIAKAKDEAKLEATKIKNSAQVDIENQRMAAVVGVKNMIGTSAIEMAEKILGRELSNRSEQESFIAQQVDKIKLS